MRYCCGFEKNQIVGAFMIGSQLVAIVVLTVIGFRLLYDDTCQPISEPPEPLSCEPRNFASANLTALAKFDAFLKFNSQSDDEASGNKSLYLRLKLQSVQLEPLNISAQGENLVFRNLSLGFKCGHRIDFTIRDSHSPPGDVNATSASNIVGANMLIKSFATDKREYSSHECKINLTLPIGDHRGAHYKCLEPKQYACVGTSASELDELNMQLTVFRMELELDGKTENVMAGHFSTNALTC